MEGELCPMLAAYRQSEASWLLLPNSERSGLDRGRNRIWEHGGVKELGARGQGPHL